jgi:signal transduction histidine kinase
MTSLGEAATHLSWLAPSAASLVALARPSGASWTQLRTDPGAVLLVLRFAAGSHPRPFSPALLHDPALLQAALELLDTPGPVAWQHPAVEPIYRLALACAAHAAHLARPTGQVDPELAWMAGLLAPLGWLAVCAVEPEAAGRCLADAAHATEPTATQARHWGLDAAAIARRLARRWRLPNWLGAIVGHLGLPKETAVALGAEAGLFQTVQRAVARVQQQVPALGLETGPLAPDPALDDLDPSTIDEPDIAVPDAAACLPGSQRPADVPLLRDLLALAEENRRLRNAPVLDQLERDLDELHRALAQQRASEEARLRAQKLSTLAEFAAGAGHEINNPLAVISGQAQYLLKVVASCQLPVASKEAGAGSTPAASDDTHAALGTGNRELATVSKALQTIVGQVQRINEILNQLMQFARPARPQRQLFDLGTLVREVVSGLADLAVSRRVRLSVAEPEQAINVFADLRQLRLALAALVRNALEAAPPDGWASVRIAAGSSTIDLLVEDSGPGPTARQKEHIFDPFYSGRQAGRGRGLGLPTAWRLAREHGGDVFLDDQTGGLTRFVLRLPREIAWDQALANGCAPSATRVNGEG